MIEVPYEWNHDYLTKILGGRKCSMLVVVFIHYCRLDLLDFCLSSLFATQIKEDLCWAL